MGWWREYSGMTMMGGEEEPVNSPRPIRVSPASRSEILRTAAENSRVRDLVVLRARREAGGVSNVEDPERVVSPSPRPVPRIIRTSPGSRSEILRAAAENSRVRDVVVLRARREASASPRGEDRHDH